MWETSNRTSSTSAASEAVGAPGSGGPSPGARAERLQELLHRLLSSDARIPDYLRIDGVELPIGDLVLPLSAFRFQKRVLEAAGLPWPMAELVRPGGATRLAPLSLGTRFWPLGSSRDIARLDASRRAELRATAAGFSVKHAAPEQASFGFTWALAEILSRRFGAGTPAGYDPPEEMIEVTTDRPGESVVFIRGFYLSTEQGFGRSSPARRTLPWGEYVFGVIKRGEAKFNPTLWSIPEVRSVHLDVEALCRKSSIY